MLGKVRITVQTLQVLQTLLDRPMDEHYGIGISEDSGLATGSIYPILARLETAGWITSDWEDIDESAEGRRRRRYYRLTHDGAAKAYSEVAKRQQRLTSTRDSTSSGWRPAAPRPGWGLS
ncbi:PadR family transcriptional regulator [Nocardia sp. NPDC047654]|uniref:PadR family transcriptional regulator n=1 Tax=Nocardia sp. NPDC047654 TaxID=3364314 RepID=UPI00370FEB87